MLIPVHGKSQTLFEIFSRPSKLISGNYLMSLFDLTLVVNTNSSNDTITMPPCSLSYCTANQQGLIYCIKNVGSNFVYLKMTPSSADSIEGSPLLYLISPGNSSKQIQPVNTHNYYIH